MKREKEDARQSGKIANQPLRAGLAQKKNALASG
jgi:hypothetical protein